MQSYESLSIAELTVYPIVLIANIFVLLRHGLSRQSGWIFLTIFCIIRIIGASFGVAYGETGSISDFEWSVSLGSVGIGALLSSAIGLLQRVIDGSSTRAPKDPKEKSQFEKIVRFIPIVGLLYRLLYAGPATATSRRSRLLQLTHLPSLIALIICIVGGTQLSSSNTSNMKQGKTMLKAGIIIFTCVFVIIAALAVCTAIEFRKICSGDQRILATVLAAMPLIAVRLVWSILVDFSNLKNFNIVYGSVVVRGVMATMEEFMVIIAFTIVGLMVPPQYEAPRSARDTETAVEGKHGLIENGDEA